MGVFDYPRTGLPVRSVLPVAAFYVLHDPAGGPEILGGYAVSSSHERPRAAITRWFRSDRRVTIVTTGLAAFATALLGLAVPSPAQAAPANAWSATTVCVESHVGSEWGVRSALGTWNEIDGGPTFVLEDSCTDYDAIVTVSYLNANNRYTGWTKWYWDETGHIVHADVTVNPQRIKAFASQDRSCQRQHTMTHEFGHALGLRHYTHSRAGSVMSYLGWDRLCGGLTAHDRAHFARLYPAQTVQKPPV